MTVNNYWTSTVDQNCIWNISVNKTKLPVAMKLAFSVCYTGVQKTAEEPVSLIQTTAAL